MWHQLATKIVQFLAPADPVRQPDVSYHTILKIIFKRIIQRFYITYSHHQ